MHRWRSPLHVTPNHSPITAPNSSLPWPYFTLTFTRLTSIVSYIQELSLGMNECVYGAKFSALSEGKRLLCNLTLLLTLILVGSSMILILILISSFRDLISQLSR